MNFAQLNRILNWSLPVGKLFDIPIRLHISLVFFLIPVFVGGLEWWISLEYVVLVVLSILAHELGHGLMAKHYNLSGLSIMLHGFGGFATSEGVRSWRQDLAIILAGPAVTFALGTICLIVGFAGQSAQVGSGAYYQFFIIKSLGDLNILLGIVNLIPLLPFDGGQALRAWLSQRRSEFSSIRLVCHLGLVLAPLLIIYGYMSVHDILKIFGFIGLITSYMTLAGSGGVRFGEIFAERKSKKEMEEVRRREEARNQAYRDQVQDRIREREERERLRKLFEDK
ncbi:MAG: site-2 protease family protein [Fimbriimonas sp.]